MGVGRSPTGSRTELAYVRSYVAKTATNERRLRSSEPRREGGRALACELGEGLAPAEHREQEGVSRPGHGRAVAPRPRHVGGLEAEAGGAAPRSEDAPELRRGLEAGHQ